ncbi:MAG: hypothetical protein J7L14_01515 [Candidatus Diapherotrites archaeon]|nr:hypothetical protein [Candidatus Diapherotrites archaeon]
MALYKCKDVHTAFELIDKKIKFKEAFDRIMLEVPEEAYEFFAEKINKHFDEWLAEFYKEQEKKKQRKRTKNN